MNTNSAQRKGELYTGDYCRMERYVQLGEQWFFDTREGIEGPFISLEQAQISLEVYLCKQSGRALLQDASSRFGLSGNNNIMDFSRDS